MSCLICTDLPLEILRRVNADLSDGVLSLRDIAAKYELDHAQLQRHDNVCRGTDEDEVGVLRRNARSLQVLIENLQGQIASGAHLGDGEEEGDKMLILSLLDAQREYRETVSTITRLQNAGNLVTRLTNEIVGPMLTAVTTITIDEMKKLREEMFILTKAYESTHPRIKKAVDHTTERLAGRFKSDVADGLESKVEAVVGKRSRN